MRESVTDFPGFGVERIVLALVSQITKRVELIEMRADVEVVKGSLRVRRSSCGRQALRSRDTHGCACER